MSDFEYSFTAQKGTQAGKDFYVIMCPMKLIPKIFLFDDPDIPAKMRAQRTLNRSRVPEIAQYMIDNPKEYIFSSITASLDGKYTFVSAGEDEKFKNIGHLTVDMNARFLINDGQHRRAAIEEALKSNFDLAKETISIVLLPDKGLKSSQQMFADLNKHAVRPTKSLGILYDIRDEESEITRSVLEMVPLFRDMTDMERTSLSNRSSKLFTLSAIYQANKLMLPIVKNEIKIKGNGTKPEDFLKEYWKTVIEYMPDWQAAWKHTMPTKELRENFIHSHGITVHALGQIGADIIPTKTWKTKLKGLKKINWSRTDPQWNGKSIFNGRINKSAHSVRLTAIQIKKNLGVKLSPLDIKEEHISRKKHDL